MNRRRLNDEDLVFWVLVIFGWPVIIPMLIVTETLNYVSMLRC